MPISKIFKKAVEDLNQKANASEEPEPIENPHGELFDDDTEVENVQDRD